MVKHEEKPAKREEEVVESGAVGPMYDDKERKKLGLPAEPVRSPVSVRMVKDGNVCEVSVSDLESHRRMGWKFQE